MPKMCAIPGLASAPFIPKPVERRNVASCYHGSTFSGWQQNQRRWQWQGERQKNKIFILTSNNFTHESCYSVHFFAIVAPLRHEISLFHELALWSRLTWHKNCRFLFLNLDNDRYGPKENFVKICQIKWNWIRLVKFEIAQIDFQVTLSFSCHPKIFLPWECDVRTSPLYCRTF